MSFNYHTAFHNILGHLTTIKSAGSVIIEDYQSQLPPAANQMVTAINQHSQQLIDEIMILKGQIYKLTEAQENKKT